MIHPTTAEHMMDVLNSLRPSERLLRAAAKTHRHDREESARMIGSALGRMDRGELIGFATVAAALYVDLATHDNNNGGGV